MLVPNSHQGSEAAGAAGPSSLPEHYASASARTRANLCAEGVLQTWNFSSTHLVEQAAAVKGPQLVLGAQQGDDAAKGRTHTSVALLITHQTCRPTLRGRWQIE